MTVIAILQIILVTMATNKAVTKSTTGLKNPGNNALNPNKSNSKLSVFTRKSIEVSQESFGISIFSTI